MKAEILCVGTELLLGDIVNTNAAYLAKELAQMGIGVYRQSVVGDNGERLRAELADAFSRVELVVMTGGLGPTYDDLTKETVAAYFGREMVMKDEILEELTRFFATTGRPMTDNNRKQAAMPKDAIVFPNENGTAPGLAVEGDGKTAILLPGPPNEMIPMFQNEVVPYLMRRSGKTIVSSSVHLIGIGESSVEDRLRDMMLSHKNPTIAPYAKTGEVRLRVTAAADCEAEARQMIAPVIEEICSIFPQYVYGVDVGDLEHAVVDALRTSGRKAAAAESCTGGMITKRLTDVAGASAVLDGGVCTYANSAKMALLGVEEAVLAEKGAVSPETAAQMAVGVRKLFQADFGVSTTGIAGPSGGTAEKPVGLVYVGIASDMGVRTVALRLGRNRKDERDAIRFSASSYALWELLKEIRAKSQRDVDNAIERQ